MTKLLRPIGVYNDEVTIFTPLNSGYGCLGCLAEIIQMQFYNYFIMST
jgi:hypothetical protein